MPSTFYTYVYFTLQDASVPTYVGKGKDKRFLVHQRKSKKPTHFQNHVHKQLQQGIFPIVVRLPKENEQSAIEEEIRLIALYGRKDRGTGTLYNKTDGGDGVSGVVMPPCRPETRAKHSANGKTNTRALAALKNFERTGEYRAKLSEAGKGRKLSAEVIAKVIATKQACGTAKSGTVKSWETRKARYPNGWKRNGELK